MSVNTGKKRKKFVWFAMLQTRFAHLSMQYKLVIVFLFLISLPLILLSYFSYQEYSRSIRDHTTKYATEITAKTLKSLDDYITDLFNLSAAPLYNSEFLDDLELNTNDLEKQKRIDTYIMNLNKIKRDTVSVYVFDQYGRPPFYNIKSGGKRNNLDEVIPLWRSIAAEGAGSPRLVSTTEVTTGSLSYYAFTVIRELKELRGMKPIGFIALDTNLQAIQHSIQDMDDLNGGTTLLLDEQNRVVYDSELKLVTSQYSDERILSQITRDRGHFSTVVEGKPYIVSYAVSSLTGWKMLSFIPRENVMRHVEMTRNVTLLATVLIISVAMTASIVIAYALTRPLKKIRSLMMEVQLGRLDVSFDAKYHDEVGLLGRHFNLMLNRVKELLQEVKMSQIRKKEAEINALQNQINPHFIYNTLETIRMTAEINDDAEVAEMTMTFGKLLRYGIDRGKEIATIGDEMEHLQNYISLQNYRFSDRFELHIRIPPAVLRVPCLKLIFQPIVENALYHGFRSIERKGVIAIDCEEAGDELRFTIADNGKGMEPEVLEQLQKRLRTASEPDSTQGMGLINVHERIKLHYGETYGLSIVSSGENGTVIALRIPKPKEQGDVETDDRGR